MLNFWGLAKTCRINIQKRPISKKNPIQYTGFKDIQNMPGKGFIIHPKYRSMAYRLLNYSQLKTINSKIRYIWYYAYHQTTFCIVLVLMFFNE